MSDQPKMATRGVVYVKRTDGHRLSYQGLFSGLLGLDRVEGHMDRAIFKKLIAAPRLLFSTLDDDYFGFFLVALGRAIRGRRTVAIFLRPMQCFEAGKIIYPLKRMIFRILKYLPGLSILSIIPFELRPKLSQVATGWVHDPQFWDTEAQLRAPQTTLLDREILRRAAGRRVLSFIGVGTAIKGLPFLSEIIMNSPELRDRLFVVAAGIIDSDCLAAGRSLESAGMLVVNRFLSDAEILSCYEVSDLVWCCYRPDYDQASGIFGRAIQAARRPVVRTESIIQDYSRYFDISPVALEFGDATTAAHSIGCALRQPQTNFEPPSAVLRSWRDAFLQKIERVL